MKKFLILGFLALFIPFQADATQLYIELTSQITPDPARSTIAGILNYIATDINGQPTSGNVIYDYGSTNNSAATPFPIFTGDTDARAYFDPIWTASVLAAANTAMGSSFYSTYQVETVDAPIYADFNALAMVARTGNYSDLLGTPAIPAAQVNSDWNATTGLASISNKPTIPTVPSNVSSFTNDSGYLIASSLTPYVTSSSLSSTLGSYETTSALSSALSGYATTSALSSYQTIASAATTYVPLTTTVAGHALSSNVTVSKSDVGLSNVSNTDTTNASNISTGTLSSGLLPTSGVSAGTYAYSSVTIDSKGRVTSASSGTAPVPQQAYDGTTKRTSAFPAFFAVTVTSGSGSVNLTTDGTSGGTPIFPNGVIPASLNLIVNDATAAYQMSAAWSNSNKTITITANKLGTANLLSGLLGQVSASATVNLSVLGY